MGHHTLLVYALAGGGALCFLTAFLLSVAGKRKPEPMQAVYCNRCGMPMWVAARVADSSSWRCADWQRCMVQSRATLPPA